MIDRCPRCGSYDRETYEQPCTWPNLVADPWHASPTPFVQVTLPRNVAERLLLHYQTGRELYDALREALAE